MVENLTAAVKTAAEIPEIPNWFAVCMGLGTVFVGLICIIIICKITGAIVGGSAKKTESEKPAPAVSAASATVENREEILAAVCAVAAEELGTEISALRVLSFKKL